MVQLGCEVDRYRSIHDRQSVVRSGVVAKGPKDGGVQPENGFKRLGDRLAKVTRRSAFSKWLAEGDHFDRLATEIDKHGVRWDEIAIWAIEEKYASESADKKFTGLAAKRAFEREAARRKKTPSAPPAAPSEPAVRMFPVSPAKPDTQDKADPQQPTDKPDTLEDFKRGLGSVGKYGGKN